MNIFTWKYIIANFGLFDVNNYPFVMVVWNIILAMVPYAFFLAFDNLWEKTRFKKVWQKICATIIFFFWFIFIPNSAYLIADVRHLVTYCPTNSYLSMCVSGSWQIMFFFVYSVFGWAFFVIFLRLMRDLLGRIFSRRTGEIFTFALIPVIALGVLFGLTERFNSWDIFIHPLAIFANLLRYMTSWLYFRNFLAFSAGLYVLYFFGNFLFKNEIVENKRTGKRKN